MATDQFRIDAILLDIDGVLHTGDSPITGAAEALAVLREQSVPVRFITNTSTVTPEVLGRRLRSMGLPVDASEIFSAVTATCDFLHAHGNPSVHLLVGKDVAPAFSHFSQSRGCPDFVVIGDIGDAWTYALLNQVFNELMQGARLVAMHRNRYWLTGSGLRMDIGAFIAGLEYVAGVTATIMGKPSRAFFDAVVAGLGVDASHVLIMGDDIESDIRGGQEAGLVTAQVRTGKYVEEVVARSGIKPHVILDSIAALPVWLSAHRLP